MELITPLLDWISSHPTWAGLFVMLTAFSESLALVGLFLPGAAMMFGIGALVGTGHMELWPTLAWAAVGAIAGDGVSFWLGRHFHQHIRVMWPFRTHPELIVRSTDFFYRHGGKSILFGRFVGPIRPVIPAVAGMLEMPPGRFIVVNVISGLLWAPAYVLPGMVFASSVGLAAEAATRLAILGGVLLGLILLIVWLTRVVFNWVHRRTYLPMRRLLEWTRLHPVMGSVPAALLDPEHPEARGLTLLAMMLLTAAIGLLLLIPFIGADGLLNNLNQYLYHTLQDLRTPQMDHVMVTITQLGDAIVLIILFTVILLWLARQRRWHAAAHWLAAAAFAMVLTRLLKLFTHISRPTELYDGISSFSFPSGHTTQSLVVYGFLAVLIARELPDRRRLTVYALAASLIGTIAFSRLYLGAHWLSDILGGVFFGLIWVSLLGIAYRHHLPASLAVRNLIVAAGLSLLLAAGWNHAVNFEHDLKHYAVQRQTGEIDLDRWWSSDWQTLPAYRFDLRGRHDHPLTLQYAGPLDSLEQLLVSKDWQRPVRLNAASWMKWLNQDSPIIELPILAQVHDGRNEGLLLVWDTGIERQLYALRLWKSDIRLQPGAIPLWIGNVSLLFLPEKNNGLTVPRTGMDFTTPFMQIEQLLSGVPADVLQLRKEERPDGAPQLLLRAQGG